MVMLVTKVTTWMTLGCGCDESDDGWLIVFVRCPIGHATLIPADDLAFMLRSGPFGKYGPIPPA
jgi:hypothetical protein